MQFQATIPHKTVATNSAQFPSRFFCSTDLLKGHPAVARLLSDLLRGHPAVARSTNIYMEKQMKNPTPNSRLHSTSSGTPSRRKFPPCARPHMMAKTFRACSAATFQLRFVFLPANVMRISEHLHTTLRHNIKISKIHKSSINLI